MKGFTLVYAVVFVIQAIQGAEILRGYMISKDSFVCIHTTSVVADITSVAVGDPSGLSTICTLMSVQDGSAAGQYLMEQQGDNTKQVTLSAGGITSFTNMGTQLTFTPEGTMAALTGINSSDVSGLTTMATSIYVADAADGEDNTDCLAKNGNYIQGSVTSTCNNQLWYFVTAACTGTGCKACNPDPAKCSECESNETKNAAETACVACSVVADCETCSVDSTDSVLCATCGSNKYPTNNGTACAVCGTAITDCAACSVNSGTTACTDCGSKYPISGGTSCDTCGNIISDCTACSGNNGTISCTVCGNDKTLSSDNSTCEATTADATTSTESSAVVEKASFMALIGICSFLMTIF